MDLLLSLDIPVVVIDAICDEAASGRDWFEQDRCAKAVICERIGKGVVLETAFVGQQARAARADDNFVPQRGIGDAAIAEFMGNGGERYLSDSGTALLRGLEDVGVLPSPDRGLAAMLHPADPARRRHAKRFKDLPAGAGVSAPGGSRWKPERIPP